MRPSVVPPEMCRPCPSTALGQFSTRRAPRSYAEVTQLSAGMRHSLWRTERRSLCAEPRYRVPHSVLGPSVAESFRSRLTTDQPPLGPTRRRRWELCQRRAWRQSHHLRASTTRCAVRRQACGPIQRVAPVPMHQTPRRTTARLEAGRAAPLPRWGSLPWWLPHLGSHGLLGTQRGLDGSSALCAAQRRVTLRGVERSARRYAVWPGVSARFFPLLGVCCWLLHRRVRNVQGVPSR